MLYKIKFPFLWESINVNDDNVDVCVELEDGKQYTFVVATPDNLKSLMQKDSLPFLKPALPLLFVEKITAENIVRLIDSLLNDNVFLLKFYCTDVE